MARGWAARALVHLNASRTPTAVGSHRAERGGRCTSPGHGSMPIAGTVRAGGPSLLIKTLEHLINVRLDHYKVVGFAGVAAAPGRPGGVNVILPGQATGNGAVFHRGVNT